MLDDATCPDDPRGVGAGRAGRGRALRGKCPVARRSRCWRQAGHLICTLSETCHTDTTSSAQHLSLPPHWPAMTLDAQPSALLLQPKIVIFMARGGLGGGSGGGGRRTAA